MRVKINQEINIARLGVGPPGVVVGASAYAVSGGPPDHDRNRSGDQLTCPCPHGSDLNWDDDFTQD